MISGYDFQNAEILGDRNDSGSKVLNKSNSTLKEPLDKLLIEGKENVSDNTETSAILQDSENKSAAQSNLVDSSSEMAHLTSDLIENKYDSKLVSTTPEMGTDLNNTNYKNGLSNDEMVATPVTKDINDSSDNNSMSLQNSINISKNYDTPENINKSVFQANGYENNSVSSNISGNSTDEEMSLLQGKMDPRIPSEENSIKDSNHPITMNDSTNNGIIFPKINSFNAKINTSEDNKVLFSSDQIEENDFINSMHNNSGEKGNVETSNSIFNAEKKLFEEKSSNSDVSVNEFFEMSKDSSSINGLLHSCIKNTSENRLPNEEDSSSNAVVENKRSENGTTVGKLSIPSTNLEEMANLPESNVNLFKPNNYSKENNKKLSDIEKTSKIILVKENRESDSDISKNICSQPVINGHLNIDHISNNTRIHSSIIRKHSQQFDNILLSSSSSRTEIETAESKCTAATKVSNEDKNNKGIKRPINENEENHYKRLKLSAPLEKSIKTEINPDETENSETSLIEEGNSNYQKVLEDGLKASSDFNPTLKDRTTNPNKLYQGLLNDVLAEEKDGIKEPEIVRTKLKRIKRKDLEDMIIDQLMNKVLYDHELGGQRELCKRLEQTLEAANKKAMRLTQEVESLKNITTKVAFEHKRRKVHLIHPTKVKRSVGIQANKSYISQGFSSAFLPDSDVRLLTPTKYQKGKRNGDTKTSASKSKGKVKVKSEIDIEREEEEVDYSGLSNLDNLNQKLNTIKENLEASRLAERLDDFSSQFSNKKLKHSKKQAINGKQFNGDGYMGCSSKVTDIVLRHPAPLPHHSCSEEVMTKGKILPGPILRVHLRNKSIILSWNITESFDESSILSYQLFSYEETKDPPSTDNWQKIGSVKALELPMACTLTQFKCGRVYHFAVRATTKKGRIGPFSVPKSLRMPLK